MPANNETGAAPASPASDVAPLAAKSAFGSLFFFCLGALIAKLAGGAFPPFFASAFDLLIYAGIAFSFALAYRRFVRRTIEARRRERARQHPDSPTAGAR